MNKLIIEVRANEYASRRDNVNVPWSAEELGVDAAACAEAGAAVYHFHARDAQGGMEFGFEAHRAAVEQIRANSDILVHPTLGFVERDGTAEDRLSHIVQMANNGIKPDFTPIDMGSSNADIFDRETGFHTTDEKVYINSTRTLRYFAETLRAKAIKPYLVIWNVPMMRATEALLREGVFDTPAYIGLGLSEGVARSVHPGTLRGMTALTDFLPADIPHIWSVTLFGGNLLPLAGVILMMGGHVSIGLGDYPYRELGEPTNADIVRRVAQIAKDCGREVATPAEAKQILEMI